MANQATSSGNPGHEPTLSRRTHAVPLRPTHHPFHIGSSTSPWQAQIKAQPPSRRPSVFGPLHAAAVPEQQRPALLAPKVATHNRLSSPAGAQAWPVRRNGHRSSLQLASTPPRPSLSFPRCALRSSLRPCYSRCSYTASWATLSQGPRPASSSRNECPWLNRCLARFLLGGTGFHLGPCPVAAASHHQTACTAATPNGASELAKRLECARLLALSDHRTAPGDLRLHSCLPQTTIWVVHPTTLPIRGPGSTRAKGCRGRRPSIGRGGTRPSKAGRRGSRPSLWSSVRWDDIRWG
jgi:hypothetical protein